MYRRFLLLAFLLIFSTNLRAEESVNQVELHSAFYQLPMSERDAGYVSKIIRNMADLNLAQLLWRKSEMEGMGRKINHVHPLRFLGHVYSHPEHVKHLDAIHKSSFKWRHFVDGLVGRMKEEMKRDNLLTHVEAFSELIGVDPALVMQYLLAHKWEGLVVQLIRIKKTD